jgi:membrane-associated phospholipid phosphatase
VMAAAGGGTVPRVAHRTVPALARLAWPALAGVGGLAGTAAASVAAAGILEREWSRPLNRAVHRFFVEHRSDRTTRFVEEVNKVADKPVQIPAILAAGSVLAIGRRRVLPAVLLLLAYRVECRLQVWIWHHAPGERPPVELAVGDPGANPSGGVARAVQIYGLMGYMLHRAWPSRRLGVTWGCGVGFAATLVSLSRLYLGRHWVTDVLGGWVFGALLLAVGIMVERVAPSGWR